MTKAEMAAIIAKQAQRRTACLNDLRNAFHEGDSEQAHVDADRALLDYINDKDITQAYGKIGKWYA